MSLLHHPAKFNIFEFSVFVTNIGHKNYLLSDNFYGMVSRLFNLLLI